MRGGSRRLAVALVVLAGCSSTETSTPRPTGRQPIESVTTTITETTTDASPPSTDVSTSSPTSTTVVAQPPAIDPVLVELGDLFDEEGVLPVDAALRLFAAIVAPLPGVEPLALAGPPPEDAAGIAIRRIDGARGELSPDVAAAFAAAIEPQPGEEEAVVEPGTTRGRATPTGDEPVAEPTVDELADQVATIIADFEELTGHDLSLPIRARVVPTSATGGDAQASAIRGESGASGCRIALPRALFGNVASSVTSTIAHEVWHCFQLDASLSAFDTGPAWMIEGQAEWAGEAYVGGSPYSAPNWNTWLLGPERSLLRRSYDAIGLYGVADASGANPWITMIPMLDQRDLAAVGTLFGGAALDAVRATASALVRAPALGAEWESYGPGITDAQAALIMSPPVGDVVQARLDVGRFASLPVVLAVSAGDIARVTIQGGAAAAVALTGSGTFAVEPGGSVQLCLRPDGCACPDGSNPGGGAPLPSASPGEGAAAVGALDAGAVSVIAGLRTLDEACNRSLVGQWTTDVATVLTTLTAPYGGGAPECTGPWGMTFTADGQFSAGFEAACSLAGAAGTGQAAFTGTYTDDGTAFTVADIAGQGSITVNAVTAPLGIVDGFRAALANPTPYTVDGDTLTFSFTAPDGNVFTLTLTRTG